MAKSQLRHTLQNQELNVMKARIRRQVSIVEKEAQTQIPGVEHPEFLLKYPDGHYVMAELLLAEANVLNAQAVLRADHI
jgi:hypothetical protein